MDGLLYTYSLIDALYNEGEDYIDCFWHFVLTVLPVDKSAATITDIQTAIANKHGLHIPIHALNVITTRAKRKGYVIQQTRNYVLTDKGLERLSSLETKREAERRINELLEDARQFLMNQEHIELSADEVKQLLLTFVNEHTALLERFLNPDTQGQSRASSPDSLPKATEAALLRYFVEVEKARPLLFRSLRDVICGSLMSRVVHTPNLAEPTRPFNKTIVYLDTNLVFSLLGLHYEEFNKPAKELLDLMVETKRFEFRVFDFTVSEIVGVLSQYPRKAKGYYPGVKVGSVYSSLRSRRWTASTLRKFIADIEQHLADKGIRIESTSVDISPSSLYAAERLADLRQYKPEQGLLGQNHDLAAIDRVVSVRGSDVRRLEDAKAFFLTSDYRLTQYCGKERGHHDKATISEVILDRVLTNILWIKKPTIMKAVPLHTIIAMHSRHLFVDKAVWERFHTTVQELRTRGTIDDRDIALLVYDQRVRELLANIEPADASKIDPEWMLQNLEETKQRIDEETSNKLAAQLQEQVAEVEDASSGRILDTWYKQRRDIKKQAIRLTTKIDNGARLALAIVLVLVIWKLTPTITAKWSVIEPFTFVAQVGSAFLVALLGVVFRRIGRKHKRQSWLLKQVERKLLRLSRIDAFVEVQGADSNIASRPSA